MTASQDRPIIVGGGLAGLSAALALAPRPVLLLTPFPLGEQASSGWAQGGIAAAMGSDDDAAQHLADTLAAGAGLCDPAATASIVARAPEVVDALAALGARFDYEPDGRIALGLEAGHGRRRIVHAADATGREIMRATVEAVRRTPSITVIENAVALDLLTDAAGVAGLLAQIDGLTTVLRSRAVVLATGGLGGLYRHTTNPLGNIGAGIAIAARAGASLTDLEFVQFHPTALDVGQDPMPLVSEAVRGEGAILIDAAGERFMAGAYPRAELEPRDVVSRAVWQALARGPVFLDARHLGVHFAEHFPSIAATCLAAGIDPASAPIPIRPAAHYHMGGIATDADGRSSLLGLWACGEAAGTGLHGANRLASNSLPEAAVTGRAVAASIAGTVAPTLSGPLMLPATPAADPAVLGRVRDTLSQHAGVLRDADGLLAAIAALLPDAEHGPAAVGLMMAVSMWRRQESRGGHARTDFPEPAAGSTRSFITLEEARRAARSLVGTLSRRSA